MLPLLSWLPATHPAEVAGSFWMLFEPLALGPFVCGQSPPGLPPGAENFLPQEIRLILRAKQWLNIASQRRYLKSSAGDVMSEQRRREKVTFFPSFSVMNRVGTPGFLGPPAAGLRLASMFQLWKCQMFIPGPWQAAWGSGLELCCQAVPSG